MRGATPKQRAAFVVLRPLQRVVLAVPGLIPLAKAALAPFPKLSRRIRGVLRLPLLQRDETLDLPRDADRVLARLRATMRGQHGNH